jgi:murein DD-endopeptidase MepM/ murein hydrolase activator NlpD
MHMTITLARADGRRVAVVSMRPLWVWVSLGLIVGFLVLEVMAVTTYIKAINRLEAYSSIMVEVEQLRVQNLRLRELETELSDLVDSQQKMLKLAGIEPALRRDGDAGDNTYGLGVLDDVTGPKLVFWPVEGDIIRGFDGVHAGVDIAAARRRTVLAAGAGHVVVATPDETWGHRLTIEHNDSLMTVYANTELNLVEAGDTVEAGQVIALVGAGFEGDEPHLHFEVLKFGDPVSPRDFYPDLFER